MPEPLDPKRWRQVSDDPRRGVRASPPERVAYLDAACPDDPDFRRRVEELVAAADAPDSSSPRRRSSAPRRSSPS